MRHRIPAIVFGHVDQDDVSSLTRYVELVLTDFCDAIGLGSGHVRVPIDSEDPQSHLVLAGGVGAYYTAALTDDRHFVRGRNDPVAGDVFSCGKPMTCNDTTSDPYSSHERNLAKHANRAVFEALRGILSFHATPIRARESVIGTLHFEDTHKNAFVSSRGNGILRLADQLASLLGASIPAVSARIDRRRRREQLEILADLDRALWPHDRKFIEEVAWMQLCDAARRLLNCEYVSLFISDPYHQDGTISLRAESGQNEEYRSRAGVIRASQLPIRSLPGGGLNGYIMYHRQLQRLTGRELRDHPSYSGRQTHEYLPSGKCNSLLALPFVDEDLAIGGFLCAENKLGSKGKSHPLLGFSATEDVYLIQLLVQKLHSLVRAFRKIPRRIEKISRVLDAATAAGVESLSPEKLFEFGGVLGDCTIWQLTADTAGALQPEALSTFEVECEHSLIELCLQALRRHRSAIVDCYARYRDAGPLDQAAALAQLCARQLAIVPIAPSDGRVGVLLALSHNPTLEADTVSILELIARCLALTRDVDSRAELVRTCIEYFRDAFVVSDERQFLDRIVKAARDIVKADHASLFLWDGRTELVLLRATTSSSLTELIDSAGYMPGVGITGQVFQLGNPTCVQSVEDPEDISAAGIFRRVPGPGSYPDVSRSKSDPADWDSSVIAVPFGKPDGASPRLAGVIRCTRGRRRGQGFVNSDAGMLQELVTFATSVFPQVRKAEEHRRQLQRLAGVVELCSDIDAFTVDPNTPHEPLVRSIVTKATGLLGCGTVAFYLRADVGRAYDLSPRPGSKPGSPSGGSKAAPQFELQACHDARRGIAAGWPEVVSGSDSRLSGLGDSGFPSWIPIPGMPSAFPSATDGEQADGILVPLYHGAEVAAFLAGARWRRPQSVWPDDHTTRDSYYVDATLLRLVGSYLVSFLGASSALRLKEDVLGQIRLLPEVIRLMEESGNVESMLEILLRFVTVREGLGFNRAMVLAVDENSGDLKAMCGIGEISAETAHEVWQSPNLGSFHSVIRAKGPLGKFHEAIRSLRIPLTPLDTAKLPVRALALRDVVVVESAKAKSAEIDERFRRTVVCDRFALVPMGARDGAGAAYVLYVDNYFNSAAIRTEDKVKLLALAVQAGYVLDNLRARSALDAAERELRARKDAVERLTQIGLCHVGFAHDLKSRRTALKLLLNKADELGKEKGTPAHVKSFLHGFLTEGNRLLDHEKSLEKLVQVSRKDFRRVACTEILSDVERTYADEVSRGQLVVKKSTGSCMVSADASMLLVVVEQLVANALKSIRDSRKPFGRCEVVAEERGNSVVVEVRDNGAGVPDRCKERIFEPLFTTGSEDSWGVGLAYCDSVVRLHDGTIKVDSSEGQFAVFTVLLPKERGDD